MHNTDLCQPVKGLAANTMSILSRVYVKPVKGLAANTVRFHAVHCPWWTKVELQKPLWGQSPVSIVVPVSQSCLVPELYLSFHPVQRVYLRGRKLHFWACALEPKPYLSLHNSSNSWPYLHSNSGGGSFAAGCACLSLSLTCPSCN